MLNSMPAVDVVVPVRNRPRLVQICLDSVRAQTLQPNAVIVVDDGSTDATPAVLADYASRWCRLHVIRSEPGGAARARNIGVAACRAPFVAFLDSDDVWHPDKLERQLALFAGRPEIGLVHCAFFLIDESGERIRAAPIFSPSKRGYIFEEMINTLYHLTGSASGVVTRRDLVIRAGGFDESLLHAEDQDMWLKLARISQVEFVPDVLLSIRWHAGNRSRQRLKSDPALALFQRIAVWNKWIDHADERAVVQAFRRETFAINNASPFRLLLHFRFYTRLKQSELALARRLFPDFPSYLRFCVRSNPRSFLHMLPDHPRSFPHMLPDRIDLGAMYHRAKLAIATHLILRYGILLRLAQSLGKFRGIEASSLSKSDNQSARQVDQ
jgi:glycosyltransferase involved in cell wall biosynthesis